MARYRRGWGKWDHALVQAIADFCADGHPPTARDLWERIGAPPETIKTRLPFKRW